MTIGFITASGAMAQPRRRPVMAWLFDIPPTTMTLSDNPSIDGGFSSYQISRYTSSLTTSGPALAIACSVSASITLPSGFDGELTTINFVFGVIVFSSASTSTRQSGGSKSYVTGVAPAMRASVAYARKPGFGTSTSSPGSTYA